MVVHASIKKGERSQINNLTLHFEGLKKKKNLRRRKEMIKLIAEINREHKVNRKKNQLRVGISKDQKMSKTFPRLPVKKERRHK